MRFTRFTGFTGHRGLRRGGRIAGIGVVAVSLTAAALVFGPASPASAAPCSDVWSGTGTSGDPYLITTRADLVAIDTCLQGGSSTSGLVFRQWGNITLGSWSPIGFNASTYFQGTYDGDCYSLSGMSVTGTYDRGLFAQLGYGSTPATIKNLKIVNPSVSGTGDGVGVLSGGASIAGNSVDTVIVTGASVTGSAGVSYVGGLIGSDRETSLTKVSLAGTISAEEVAGLVGYNGGAITESSFVGTLTGSKQGAHGLADGPLSIANSYTQATINAQLARGFKRGASGLANDMAGAKTITNSYAAVTVSGSGGPSYGDIYGASGGTTATLRIRNAGKPWSSMVQLPITGTNGTGSLGVGTNAGTRTTGSDGSGFYSDYALTATSGLTNGSVTNIRFSGIQAGIIGDATGVTATDTFFDSTLAPTPSSGVLSTDNTNFNASPVSGVTPKSTLDMKTASTYTGAGWSTSIWSLPGTPGAKYPTHAWVTAFAPGCSSGNAPPPTPSDGGSTPAPQQTCGGAGCDTPPPSAQPVPTAAASPSASSAAQVQAALDPIHNEVNGNVPGAGLPPGGALLLVGGVPASVTVQADAPSDAKGVDVSGPGFFMKLVGVGDRQQELGVQGSSTLVLQSFQTPNQRRSAARAVVGPRGLAAPGAVPAVPAVPAQCAVRTPMVRSAGNGFLGNSVVKLYVLPSTYVGELPTDASGSYSGELPMPAGVAAGTQTLQANGFTPGGAVRSVSLGIRVDPTRSVTVRSEQGNVYFAPLSAALTARAKVTLAGLVAKAKKAGIRTVVVGFVQQVGGSANDASLSTARARTVAQYLRSRGLTGAYVVRGDGHAGPKDQARRVSVSIRYAKGC